MSAGKPFAALVTERATGRWRIELRDLKSFRDSLGADVVTAFCGCFVHADRLTSLTSFGYLSLKHHGDSSPGLDRNLQTMAWFAVGMLRELASTIRALRSALAKRGLLDSTSDVWQVLRGVEDRWDGDPFFRGMRNTVAFHVNPVAIEAGLAAMEANGDAVLCEGQDRKNDQSRMRLGLEALLNGSGKSLADFGRFMRTLSEDHGIAHWIQRAFLLALDAKGIPMNRSILMRSKLIAPAYPGGALQPNYSLKGGQWRIFASVDGTCPMAETQ